ncbi:ABC transporter permease [Bacteriovorax stolpii]|mgnify:CR=1 FL=1|uniref:ABC transporter permease n=1 Tax=Bacteriovorax stolpii TaxID=960 RepID=A0A2K9NVS4_BACTC|nr:ABC transporter permease [Bacteriovorax stolpii]AUN99618.1 ABC transporter permease [Bacteriovorax stolpii]QDK40387.1 ABC transporter permease [Bacteriovorax stolpii]TDP51248.1 peptide/nickel transport system permease protein [Bacteriovorax stolpii]BDT29795.1 ABC transporter permease [Bacteriovorax sp. HI3]
MTTDTKTIALEVPATKNKASKSLWQHAFSTIVKDKLALVSLIIVGFYFLIALLTFLGVIASNWGVEVGPSYAPPSAEYIFGTDIFGRSVFLKMVKGAETAVAIGLATSFIALFIGTTLGALAGYFGGIVDEIIVWFYTTFSSIPFIMLLVAIAFIMGKGTSTVFISLGVTSWVGLCRIVRGEVMKHKDREYSQAANALGAGHTRKIFKHILPNITHVLIINFSLTFEAAIKSEVILSYLGLGVQGRPSWGTMIDDSKLELARGVWWQLGAATLAMFFIVLAFNILGDALRDALDPKLKGK